MTNLQLIEDQPRWRVWLVAWLARIIGVVIHVEGIPFGSSRVRKKRAQDETPMGEETGAQIGGATRQAQG